VTLSASDFDEAEFFDILARADALLLPVNFGRHSIDLLRYSMPTKVPSYLASGTPILVFGPPQTAQVQYARDSGWGHVIAERSIPALKAGIRRIVDDLPLRQKLSAAAHKASVNHDAKVVRVAFQHALCNAAGAPPPGKR
jgi:glycosyltransferase involved in cell wall biosynthesis